MAVHNCWTDAVWFFPGLSLHAALADPQIGMTYLGQESRSDAAVQHVQLFRAISGQSADVVASVPTFKSDRPLSGRDFKLARGNRPHVDRLARFVVRTRNLHLLAGKPLGLMLVIKLISGFFRAVVQHEFPTRLHAGERAILGVVRLGHLISRP